MFALTVHTWEASRDEIRPAFAGNELLDRMKAETGDVAHPYVLNPIPAAQSPNLRDLQSTTERTRLAGNRTRLANKQTNKQTNAEPTHRVLCLFVYLPSDVALHSYA